VGVGLASLTSVAETVGPGNWEAEAVVEALGCG
jgi:hypothetical protein